MIYWVWYNDTRHRLRTRTILKTKIKTKGRANALDKQIGATLRALRESRGFSQTHAASCAGLTFQQWQKYENGKNRISASTLWEIAKFFGVPVDYFLPEAARSSESREVHSQKSYIEDLEARLAAIHAHSDLGKPPA